MLDLDQIIDQVPPTSGKIMHLLEHLKSFGEPITLSINGRGNLSVSDDGAYQLLFTLVERLEVTEMLRERLAELDAGCPTYSSEEAKDLNRAASEYRIPPGMVPT
jgi:hypothetical protein